MAVCKRVPASIHYAHAHAHAHTPAPLRAAPQDLQQQNAALRAEITELKAAMGVRNGGHGGNDGGAAAAAAGTEGALAAIPAPLESSQKMDTSTAAAGASAVQPPGTEAADSSETLSAVRPSHAACLSLQSAPHEAATLGQAGRNAAVWLQVQRWWGQLEALCLQPAAFEDGDAAAAAVVAQAKDLFERYPDLLRAALVQGHVVELCNQQHCPTRLRCAPTAARMHRMHARAGRARR
jgi:hypothetical protein